MLKILQTKLQQYMNHKLPDVQAEFRKVRDPEIQRTRGQIANIYWITKKGREFQKSIYLCFTDYDKAFDCVDHNKLWKILKEMGIPDIPYLPLEKPVCRSGSNSRNMTCSNRLVPNWERNISRLYIIIVFI